ncbi:HD-GYP domain-containing protein [Geomonas subterranea]|uniref:Response regulator n=1 Tax=Geomonas subterranea TaxID=2847989 RepID=A0ABX8LF50_9BACT|nr:MULTISPECIES: HD domain-containing phosphohydrolase [Geomonas]QXE89491.1 response regulator [Geomonas subterranea]QXM08394.1 response regulator [Geomonas subterranea]
MFEDVKVILADDDPLNLDLLEKMLQQFECTLIRAGDGQQVLDAITAAPQVDLVVMDLKMPVLDGYEVLRRIKQDVHWHDIPVVVVTADGAEVATVLELGANDFIAKPFNLIELRHRVMNQIRNKRLADFAKDTNAVLEVEVAKRTAALQQALAKALQTEYEISLRLGRAAEFRDQETGSHLKCISQLSKRLGQLAGIPADQCDILYFASLLHDVGKIGIPDSILLKPGKLTPEEFAAMKEHTVIGGKIMSGARDYPVIEAGRIIALQHHEKWDGKGYPYGLKGEEIHIFARVVSIVDVFDALLTERVYKRAFSPEETAGIMMDESGSSFDPHLLELFFKHVEEFLDLQKNIHADAHPFASITEMIR